MEYPELFPIALAIAIAGAIASASHRVRAAIHRQEERFRSVLWSSLALLVIAAFYAVLATPLAFTSRPSWFVIAITSFFAAPALGWLIFRGAPASWLRISGAVGLLYPLAFFIVAVAGRS